MLNSGIIKLVLLTIVHSALSSHCGVRTGRGPISCQDVLKYNPNAESGPYKLVDISKNEEYYAYCDMDSVCGGKGWTKIADVNMDQKDQECPSGMRFYENGGVRTCVRSSTPCTSTFFTPRDIQYSEVCGRVIAYQYGSPDAFQLDTRDINTAYVDGISITRGFPREHVWTLAMGLQDTLTLESGSNLDIQCPCNSDGDPSKVPDFVGDDYYCESGCHGNWAFIFYPDDPLFDNKDCGPLETACCNKGLLPYFYKDLGSKSNDDIELRICASHGSGDEDACITIIELFVR